MSRLHPFVCLFAFALCGSATASAHAAETATRTFATAGENPFVVPAGVTSLQVTLVGGNGGAGSGGAAGGLPASASATLAVSAGETLYAEVAGDGGAATVPDSAIGGSGGGDSGGEVFTLFGTAASGGGGGGASDIRTCSTAAAACQSLASRLAVAGGGGGGGGTGAVKSTPVAGGAGGAAEFPGSNGSSDGSDAVGGAGGEATHSAGGAAGTGGETTAGSLGIGGQAGDSSFVGGAGGGGGGGIYGGGGGGSGAGHIVGGTEGFGSGGGGGGGGSSGVPAGASGVSAFALLATAHNAEPAVTISWTMPPPASVTGTPTAITGTSATLTGRVNPDGSQLSDCRFTISPAPPLGGSIPCAQQVGAGEAPVAVSAAPTGLQPNTTYTVTLTAASAQGTSSGSPLSFTTPPPSTSQSSSAGLTLTALKLSVNRFRRGRHAASIASAHRARKRTAASTTISFLLSQAATAQLSFESPRVGMVVGRSCTRPTKAHRKGRHCTRYMSVVGGVTLAAHDGADKISFDGVLDRGRRLAPGAYRLSLRASSGAARASAPQHPTLTLLP